MKPRRVRQEHSEVGYSVNANTRNPFRHFKNEGVEQKLEQKVVDDISPGVLALIDAWLQLSRIEPYPTEVKYYGAAQPLVKKLTYTSEDVTKFCLALLSFTDDPHFNFKLSAMLNAAVNLGADKEYYLDLSVFELDPTGFGLRSPIDIGYLLKTGKTLTVDGTGFLSVGKQARKNSKIILNGDAGNFVGRKLPASVELIIKGNAGLRVGSGNGNVTVFGDAGGEAGLGKKYGILVVKGKAGDYAAKGVHGGSLTFESSVGKGFATNMRGGVARVLGRAGRDACREMTGGEVHFEDEVESFGIILGGRVYHRGELIHSK